VYPSRPTPDTPFGDGNTVRGLIEAVLFTGDRYEAQIELSSGESVLLYLPSTDRWREGQAVCLRMPAEEVRVWPA
jgi:hypothetical protein